MFDNTGTVELINPCGTPGERFYFGGEHIETWYLANPGVQTGKSGSVILHDETGNEITRINIFEITPKGYVPGSSVRPKRRSPSAAPTSRRGSMGVP